MPELTISAALFAVSCFDLSCVVFLGREKGNSIQEHLLWAE